jgi:hypothetical protein
MGERRRGGVEARRTGSCSQHSSGISRNSRNLSVTADNKKLFDSLALTGAGIGCGEQRSWGTFSLPGGLGAVRGAFMRLILNRLKPHSERLINAA